MAGLEFANGSRARSVTPATTAAAAVTSVSTSIPARMAGVPTDTAAGPSLPGSRLNEALNQFDRESDSQSPPDSTGVVSTLMRNALLLIEHRENHLAMNLLRNVLMRRRDDADALRWLGHCHRELGQLSEALTCFRTLARVRTDGEAFELMAESLYLLERDEEAQEAYNRALARLTEASPRLFDIYKNLGNIHARAGDFDAAEECYNKANTVKPDSDILMVNYGTLEIQRENIDEAVERFRRAVELNPANDRGWVGLAMVHRQMGDFELARANVERALDINPRNKTALHLLVDWNAQDRDFAGSVRRLHDYLALHGEDAEMSFLLARILIHLNRLSEAVLEMERALALEPTIEGGEQVMAALREEIRRRSEPA
jgi:tetratricopeptide (TPR) repeat protein